MSSAPNQKPLEQQLRDAAARTEEELHRFVRFLDDKVVPEVRRNGSSALRAAAIELQKLADRMDDARANAGKPTPGPNSPPGHS